jgi:hypothetical protein
MVDGAKWIDLLGTRNALNTSRSNQADGQADGQVDDQHAATKVRAVVGKALPASKALPVI